MATGSGDAESGRRASLQRGFRRQYWLFVEPAAEFTFRARDAAGTMVMATLAGVKDSEVQKNRAQNPVNAEARASRDKLRWWADKNLALRFLKDPDVAQIQVGGFGGANYPRWMEDTFRALHEKQAKVLILDLRGNGGGNDMYGAMLVSYLTDKSFRYFDHINVKTVDPSFKEHSTWSAAAGQRLRAGVEPNPASGFLVTPKLHPGVAEQRPGKYPFTGKVFVLIDGGTFSTAADFCAVVHHLKRATFVGEETGGGYYGNNSGFGITLKLPKSGVRVGIPLYEYWNAVPGYDGKRRGTRPDFPVATTAADLIRGADRPLEVATKLAAEALREGTK